MAYTIYEDYEDERFYIKIESEHDSTLSGATLLSINLIEGFRYALPYFVLKFIDNYGDLIHHTYIDPSAIYNLYLGTDPDSAKKSLFSLGSFTSENINSGRPDNIGINATFMMSLWSEWMRKTHSRSWTDRRFSYVAESIAGEVGFDSTDIDSTKFSQNIIQPNWTNHQLMKWMTRNAISNDNIGGYNMGVTNQNHLIFKTFDSLFSQKPVKDISLGDDTNEEHFRNFEIHQQYVDVVTQGAGGMTYMYYDYENRDWVENTAKIGDTRQRQLSDWFFLANEHEDAERLFYNGRDPRTKDVVNNRVSNLANSIMSVDISIQGDMDLHMGDIINVIIPASEFSKLTLNAVYSGYWMITKVNHRISMNTRNFVTHLTLARPGFNGTQFTNFTKTQVGRKIS